MEQSDLDLLHTVPLHHLQILAKSRRLPPSAVAPSITVRELAQHLFNPHAIDEVLATLGEKESLILHELVACGGRANSRDLALYLTSSGLFNDAVGTDPASIRSDSIQGFVQGAPHYPIPHPHGAFELAVRHLLLLGLLFWGKQTNFGGRDYTSGVYDGVLIVPQAVIDNVRNLQARSQGRDVTLPAYSTLSIAQSIYTFQRTLYLYWSLVAATREGLPLVTNGLLSRQALRQVIEQIGLDSYHVTPGSASAMSDTSPGLDGLRPSITTPVQEIRAEYEAPRLLFIRLLLMKLGLLREQQGSLVAPRSIEETAKAFFSLPLLERTHRCYRAWLEDTFWNELAFLPEVIVRPGPAPLEPAHEEILQARQTVVARVLAEQTGMDRRGGSGEDVGRRPVDEPTSIQPPPWCDLSAFVARTKLYAPYLLFPRRYGARADRYSIGSNPYGWDFRLRRGWLTHREGWHLVEGGFIRAIITGPLHWLGLVELNNTDPPSAFRLAECISFITADTPINYEEPASGRLIVQPTFELVAMAPVSEALLFNLDHFAERISLELIAQYRLTKASVTRAIQMGLHANTIQQILEQASGSELPQNVQYSLQEWDRQARRIELWPAATLLEVDDPALLDTLFSHEETRPLLGRRLSPTLVEVPRHQLLALQDALWQRDYLPALVSAPNTLVESGFIAGPGSTSRCEPQWRLHDNGLLEPLYAVLNLYLVAELEYFSEYDEATGWRRITPISLQHAYEMGLSLEYIMRFLKDYCEAGMPNSFFIRLKIWGGGYPDQPTIHVEHTPLLALPPQILQDLQADEQLRELLGTEVAPQLRLVHIAQDKLLRAIELLQERGFEVT